MKQIKHKNSMICVYVAQMLMISGFLLITLAGIPDFHQHITLQFIFLWVISVYFLRV